jgi:membrane-bound lytic murein transglycosylase A
MGKSRFLFLLLFCTLFLCFSGCGKKSLQPLATTKYPLFRDDHAYTGLDRAMEQSLIYLRKRPPSTHLGIGNHNYSINHLIRSIEFFRILIAKHPSANLLNRQISTYFDVFQASGTEGYNPKRRMLVTGYYQPLFEGSPVRKAPFLYPLYGIPSDLVLRRNSKSGTKQIGRLEGSHFRQYWTRAEIETGTSAGGNELVYLRDPMDAFLLHIQGSGLIRMTDGTIKGIHYAMKNGRQYKSIGKYMVKTGRMNLEEASIATIRNYLAAHPEEMKEILHHNESFIFFEWTSTHGAIGNLGRELTAGRSIAVDQRCFPAGSLAFLRSRKPVQNGDVINWVPLERFVLAQDTGSAIRGPGRVDLFWGSGQKAGLAAGRMKEDGALYFLLLKEQFL